MLSRLKSALTSRRPRQTGVAAGGLFVLLLLFDALRRLGDLKLYVVETIALGLLAGIVYLIALYLFQVSDDTPAAFWMILAGALLFRLLLFPLTPALSDDVYRYRWEARIQQAGVNPYAVRPDDLSLAHLRDADWHKTPGRDIPTIYPPLSEFIWRLAYRFLPGPVAFKLPSLLADLLIVGILAGWIRSTGGRNLTLALYAWNPLVIVEFAASGHYDSLAMAAVFAASCLIIRGRGTLSTLLLTAGALLKVFPALLFPLWLRRSGWPRTAVSWLNAAAAAALALLCAWPFRSSWHHLLESLAYYESRWHNNSSLYVLCFWLSGSADLASALGAGVVAGLAAWVAARRVDGMRAAYLLIGAALLFSPNAFSWYFAWIIPFLCFFPNPAWLMLTILQFLSYHVLIDYQAFGAWHFQPKYLWLTYAPFYAVLIFSRLRGARDDSTSRA